jgi:hypothetical protein
MSPPVPAVRLAATLLAALASAGPAAAESPELARARALKGELRYHEAAEAAAAALASGRADPAELAAIHRLAGEIAAGLEDAAAAEDHFAALLALEPGATLPPGASPKLRAPFEAARRRLAGRAFAARHRVEDRAVAIEIDDPLAMARRAGLEIAGGDAVEVAGPPPYRLEVPGTGEARAVAAILDARGNRLAVLGSASVPIVIAAATTAVPEEAVATSSDAAPLWARGTSWAIAGAGLAAIAGGFALLAADAQSDLDALSDQARGDPFAVDFEEAQDVERRGRRYALAANIGFAAAGASGIAAVALWLWGPDEPTATPALSTGRDGLSLGIHGHF